MSSAVKALSIYWEYICFSFFSTPLFQILKQKLYKNVDNIKEISLILIIAILLNCLFWALNAISS